MVAQFSFFPIGKGPSLSSLLAKVVPLIEKSRLSYRVGAMGTSVEGDTARIMRLIQRCQERLLRDCPRVITLITLDERNGAEYQKGRLNAKIISLERKLKRRLPK